MRDDPNSEHFELEQEDDYFDARDSEIVTNFRIYGLLKNFSDDGIVKLIILSMAFWAVTHPHGYYYSKLDF